MINLQSRSAICDRRITESANHRISIRIRRCHGSVLTCRLQADSRARSIARRPHAARRCRSSPSRPANGAPESCPPTKWRCFRRRVEETGIRPVVAHNSYLINVGCGGVRAARRSRLRRSARNSIARSCSGSTGSSCIPARTRPAARRMACARSARAIAGLLEGAAALSREGTARAHRRPGHQPRLPIRTSGDDSRPRRRSSPRVGVCLDTCHLLTAGYDLCTDEGYDATFRDFDRIVGLDRLQGAST